MAGKNAEAQEHSFVFRQKRGTLQDGGLYFNIVNSFLLWRRTAPGCEMQFFSHFLDWSNGDLEQKTLREWNSAPKMH